MAEQYSKLLIDSVPEEIIPSIINSHTFFDFICTLLEEIKNKGYSLTNNQCVNIIINQRDYFVNSLHKRNIISTSLKNELTLLPETSIRVHVECVYENWREHKYEIKSKCCIFNYCKNNYRASSTFKYSKINPTIMDIDIETI
jgi:hypothetical protein